MKRNEIVGKLIKEGFSEKTLVGFTDKQLIDLHERMTVKAADLSDPNIKKIVSDPTTQVQVVKEKETAPGELKGGQKKLDKNHNGKIDGQDFKIMKGQKKKKGEEKPEEGKEIKEWVEKLGENYYHSLTSKNEIMELIQTKLNESETVTPMPAKAKKGHNDVMEFMTYDAAEPTTKPKEPTTKPGTKEPPKTRPSHPGKNPNPGVNPGPKAIKPEEAKDKVIKVIKGILQK
jgi:hypothetical protein